MNMTERRISASCQTINILSATSELFPLVKTGGLADVTGALPKTLEPFGIHTRTLLPAYAGISDLCDGVGLVTTLDLFGEAAHLLSGKKDGLDILLLDCPALFQRPGGPYANEDGDDHRDNWKRFAALSLATAKIAAGCLDDWTPHVVHLHDWQTALAAAYIRAWRLKTPVVLTIHNLAFRGQFPAGVFPSLQLPDQFGSIDCLEYFGDICFLKGGIACSDAITTVSPTYAREILTDELGMGMQGILSKRRKVLRGIVNGIDAEIWNPVRDPYIPACYDLRTISRRRHNRNKIEAKFGLHKSEGAILSIVSRLTWQKGIDLVHAVIPGLIDRGAKLLIYGQGDAAITQPLIEHARRHPGKVVVHVGYDEADAHLLHAGSDIILQPSRFEPCGLTQLYALRYGAVPIVARTGGLAETIIDANEAAMAAQVATGFQFQPGSCEDLCHAIDRALTAYTRPAFWRRLQKQAMKADFAWSRSARQYAQLYAELLFRDNGELHHSKLQGERK